MADSAAQVRRVAGRLRARGFRVEEVDGWESRGRGRMSTRGRVEHHTAGPRTSSGTPSLRVVTFGRAGLRNSLSRWYVSPRGVIYLVALGVSWHAGSGSKGSNSTLSGTEAEHSGRSSQPWPARQLDAMAAISQEEADEFGFTTGAVWEHKEHAPSRKVDRINIDGDDWRRRLAQEDDDMTPQQARMLEELHQVVAIGHNDDGTPVIRHTDEFLGTMLRRLPGRTAEEVVAADRARLVEAVAAIRKAAGVDPDDEWDRTHAARVQAGEYDLAEVAARMLEVHG